MAYQEDKYVDENGRTHYLHHHHTLLNSAKLKLRRHREEAQRAENPVLCAGVEIGSGNINVIVKFLPVVGVCMPQTQINTNARILKLLSIIHLKKLEEVQIQLI